MLTVQTQSTDPNGANYQAPAPGVQQGSQQAQTLGWYTGANNAPVMNSGTQGGFNPINTASQGSSSGFTSSAQPIINQQTNSGLANGMSAVNGGSQGGQSQSGTTVTTDNGNGQSTTSNLDPVMSVFHNYSNQVASILGQTTQNQTNAATNVYNATMQNAQLANQQIALQYNTGLGQLNTQYSQAFQQLQTQHAQSIGSAVAAIAAADPNGMQGGSFASSYVGKVNDLYSQQSSFLTAAYGQQQQALSNGNMEATLGIQQQINSAQAQFGQTLAGIQQGAMQTLLQLGQTGLGIAQFEQSRSLQSQGLFTTSMNQLNIRGATLPNGTKLSSLIDPTTGTMNINTSEINAAAGKNGQFDPGAIKDPNTKAFVQYLQGLPQWSQGIAAGYTPQQIVDAAVTGTTGQARTAIDQMNYGLSFSKGTAQYGALPGMGGSGTGASGAGGTSTLSPFGQSLVSGGGKASLTTNTGAVNQIEQLTSFGSNETMSSLKNFVNSGSSNVATTVLGGFMNNFFGANISDITSSKEVGNALSQYLGISSGDLAALSNQSASTRAKVMTSILTDIRGQVISKSRTLSHTYNLSGNASDLDQTVTNIDQTIQALQSSGGNSGSGILSGVAQGGTAGYMSSIQSGTSWDNLGGSMSSWFTSPK